VSTKEDIEEGAEFIPKFDDNGLIPVIAQDSQTGQILMVAYMNRQALDLTTRPAMPHTSAGRDKNYGRKASRAATSKK